MRNGEVGMEYVKDREVGWTPVVSRRRKKSASSEESESSGNLNMNDKRRSLIIQEGGRDPENFYLWKFESGKMGGSEAQPYCLEDKN